MLCNFDDVSMTCLQCGYQAKRLPTYRLCAPVSTPTELMIGDVLEKWLTSAGITKDRVERLTKKVGKSGGCGCQQRQQWLNEKGVKLQRRVRALLERARKAYGL